MSHKILRSPAILGVGLTCLDIIRTSGCNRFYNGGSCGNVVSALSYLGWNASVVTGSYSDLASKIFQANLSMLGVEQIADDRRVQQTPRIVEDLTLINNLYADHKYLLTCPDCGQELPSIKPLGELSAKTIAATATDYDVLYTDRSSPGLKLLRSIFKTRKAWTVFEPNSARNLDSFFKNALDSHIVKFSLDRISFKIAEQLKKLANKSTIVLIVYTAGKDGLYYSYRKRDQKMSDWFHLSAQPASRFIDASGAGDWCTTGLLAGLIEKGHPAKSWLVKEEVIGALQYGQALAAISCAFVGAQGLFYADINDRIESKLFKSKRPNTSPIRPVHITKEITLGHCSSCLLSL